MPHFKITADMTLVFSDGADCLGRERGGEDGGDEGKERGHHSHRHPHPPPGWAARTLQTLPPTTRWCSC